MKACPEPDERSQNHSKLLVNWQQIVTTISATANYEDFLHWHHLIS